MGRHRCSRTIRPRPMAEMQRPKFSWPRDRPAYDGTGFFRKNVWAMSRRERLALVDHDDPVVSVVAQCRMLKVARSSPVLPAGAGECGLAVMRQMDELHL